MKQYPYIRPTLLGLAGLMLAFWPDAANAQTATIPMPPGAIQPNGDPNDNTLDWGVWWQNTGTATEVFDPTVSSSTNIPGSIHVTILMPGAAANPGGGANISFGDFIAAVGPSGWLGQDESSEVDFSRYSALSFDILVNTATSSNTDIPINLFSWDYDQVQIGSVSIPATMAWQHVSIPIPATFTFNDTNAPPPNGTAWGFFDWYPNTPPACSDFWIDNVQLVGEGFIPPPKMTISKAVQGLNLFAGSGANNYYSRENIETTAADYSWAKAPGPVSYSFTITNYPIPSGDAFQVQIFLCPNPGTESAVDWGETNIVFMELDSGTDWASWNFRYKTNNANNNTMLFGAGGLATIGTNTAIGTWTVTFNNNTNVTMLIPGGASTNFNIPDPTGATTALFASNVVLYFGVQANGTAGQNDHIVASDFSVTGLGSADFNDNFVADAGELNTNIWEVNAAFPACVIMVGPDNPYWIEWTTPASGYTLQSTAALSTNMLWSSPTTWHSFFNGADVTQLINTNDLPAGNADFFALVQRTASQLLVLLPGETNAPGTATGKTGTPTPVDLISANGEVVVTVLAVDAHWYPIAGNNDTVQISSSDPSGFVVGANPVALNNGSAQVTWYFQTPGTQTITATDTSNTSISPNTDTISVLNQ
jgi:hypothetical protein